ncbi:MAG: pyrroloquinoline quinone biosynthesis peptide chaperone PqqD [Hyphomicrobium sp.]|nr:pyrroloquinoline quinone biosynthesis peptide chaperone PqqD [Hyphomicrobium sp.]
MPPSAKPAFAPGVRLAHNEAQGGWVLLAPERVLKTDEISYQILKRCNGETSIASIVDELTIAFDAPRERIFADVSALFAQLVQKRLVNIS